MKLIPLTQNKFAIVDDKNFEKLSQNKWFASKQRNGDFYAAGYIDKKLTLMHRLIMNVPADKVIDHANFNGLDNREKNLRPCSNAENVRHQRTQRGSKSSKYKGVWLRKKKWNAGIKYKGKKIHIGCFENEVDAAIAYDNKAKELFGEFASPNFLTKAG